MCGVQLQLDGIKHSWCKNIPYWSIKIVNKFNMPIWFIVPVITAKLYKSTTAEANERWKSGQWNDSVYVVTRWLKHCLHNICRTIVTVCHKGVYPWTAYSICSLAIIPKNKRVHSWLLQFRCGMQQFQNLLTIFWKCCRTTALPILFLNKLQEWCLFEPIWCSDLLYRTDSRVTRYPQNDVLSGYFGNFVHVCPPSVENVIAIFVLEIWSSNLPRVLCYFAGGLGKFCLRIVSPCLRF